MVAKDNPCSTQQKMKVSELPDGIKRAVIGVTKNRPEDGYF
jgi:hypothetical protein